MEITTTRTEWVAVVTARLQQHWPRIEPAQLEELAIDLSRDDLLRALPPEQAARVWLQPVTP
jgi:hypothetical protein